jgi:hypothetical protein
MAIATMSATWTIGTGATGMTEIGLWANAQRAVEWGEVVWE